MNDLLSSPIEVSIPNDNEYKLTFATIGELEVWVKDEMESWKWIIGNSWPRADLDAFREAINQRVASLKSAPGNGPPTEATIAQIKNLFREYFGPQRNLLTSRQPAGKFIISLADDSNIVENKRAALGAYFFLRSVTPAQAQWNNGHFMVGYIRGALFRLGVDLKTVDAIGDSLASLRNDYATEVDEAKRRELERVNLSKKLDEGATRFVRQAKRKAVETWKQAKTEVASVIADAQKTLREHIEVFDRQLALKSPVDYWSSRYKWHLGGAVLFGVLSLAGGIACAYWVLFVTHELLMNVPVGKQPEYWRLASVAVVTFMALWIARILVRLFFSNLHLATDASERKLMIQTYLSLSKEGEPYSPEDKELILKHIFRSASDGIVKDDASPPWWLDALVKSR